MTGHLGRVISLAASVVALLLALCFSFQDEIPVGSVQGLALKAEGQVPAAGVTIWARPVFVVTEDLPDARRTRTDDQGRFHLRGLQEGVWQLEGSGRHHHGPAVQVTITEGELAAAQLELVPDPPRIELYASQRIYAPQSAPEVRAHGFGPDATLEFTIWQIDFNSLAATGSIEELYWQELSVAVEGEWDRTFNTDAAAIKKYDSFTYALRERDPEGGFTERVTMPILPPGIYYVLCSAWGQQQGTFLEITDLALVSKSTDDELLTWVTRLDTGQPVEGATVYLQSTDAPERLGVTGADGLLRAAMPAGGGSRIGLYAERGDSRALLGLWTGWDDGTPAGEPLKLWLHTDRPIYRPGHTIAYRGLARKRSPDGYGLPRAKAVLVELRDFEDNLVAANAHTLSAIGTFHGEVTLNAEAPTGIYYLNIQSDGNEESYPVEVAAYRKPEYVVRVLPQAPFVVTGETSEVSVQAEYYFGGPVPNAEVSLYVLRTPTWHDPFALEAWDSGWDTGGEFVESLTATTDNNGVAKFRIPATIPDPDAEQYWLADNDYRYNLTASVVDEGGKYYEGKGTFLVTHSTLAVQVSPDRWVAPPGSDIPYTVTAKRHDGQPLSSQQQVTVQWGYEVWEEDARTKRWTRREEPGGSEVLTVGADGTATGKVRAVSQGELVIRVQAKDDRGRAAIARAWCWITDGSPLPGGQHQRTLRIQPDFPSYAVGDTAQLLLSGAEAGEQLLLTVESDRIWYAQVITIGKDSSLIPLPIEAAWLPNVYVSLTQVQNRELMQASAQLRIDTTMREIQVAIETPQQIVKPGDTVTYALRTTDTSGAPLAAEVALGIVDESIYALREDPTDPIGALYPRRWNSVSTAYSFAPIYLDGGDKGSINADIRTRFLDTAAWMPAIMTNAQGVAEVAVTLPDNLTQWRATAVALTADSRVGMATHKLRARKDLMIRLQLPRTFTQQDTTELIAVLHNETEAPLQVTTTAETTIAQLSGEASRTLTLPPGTPTAVRWPITCPTPGDASFTVTAKAGSLTDGVMQRVPVQPRGYVQRARTGGQFSDSTTFTFALEPDAIRESGGIELALTPTLAHSLLNALDYLIGYPYGCTEQTMSRFLPSVLAADALRRLDLPTPPVAATLPDIVAKSYARLQRFQHDDGGWGWWEYDESDPWMTAYVLEGCARAAEAGYPPPRSMVRDGLQWVRGFLERNSTEESLSLHRGGRLFLLRALALHGETDTVRGFINPDFYSRLTTPAQLSSGIIIAQALGDQPRADALAARLAQQAVRTPDGAASWEEAWWGVETTAQGLLALVTANPRDPLIPEVITYLERQRRGAYWTSTRDTAITINALSRYLQRTGAGSVADTITISLNGTVISAQSYDAGLSLTPFLLQIPTSQLRPGQNEITLSKTDSSSPCFYSAGITQVVAEPVLKARPLGSQLTVRREYYRLQVRRDADGNQRLLPAPKPATRFKAGDVLRCVVTITSDTDREFIMLRDPLPGGFECIERTAPEDRWSWMHWWAQTDLRDDHIAFFARTLLTGEREFSYLLRAEQPGTWQALPSHVEAMYAPQISAISEGLTLEITP